jgi:hypothetical protein
MKDNQERSEAIEDDDKSDPKLSRLGGSRWGRRKKELT